VRAKGQVLWTHDVEVCLLDEHHESNNADTNHGHDAPTVNKVSASGTQFSRRPWAMTQEQAQDRGGQYTTSWKRDQEQGIE